MNQDAGNGASVILSNNTNETSDITIGVDVSKFQGTIDWTQAASSGVDFAMIRVGYRAQKTGIIYADTNAKYNMQQAAANGIKVGAYFFSSAVNEAEAIEEADWVADFIADYSITYPVAFDCEGFNTSESRQKSMTKAERTAVAAAFYRKYMIKAIHLCSMPLHLSLPITANGTLPVLKNHLRYGLHNIRQRLIQRLHPHHIQEHAACGSILIRAG